MIKSTRNGIQSGLLHNIDEAKSIHNVQEKGRKNKRRCLKRRVPKLMFCENYILKP